MERYSCYSWLVVPKGVYMESSQRCISREDNNSTIANNPYNITEYPDEYLARKVKQIKELLIMLSN